jgi:glycosyltransferase involved in cell wall biosynthesis
MTRRDPSGRLTLFLPTLDDGGAEHVMLQLGASFVARGLAVDLVVGVPGGPLEPRIPPGVRVVDLAAPRTTRALPGLARYLARERPSALLSTLEHANVLAVWARALARSRTRLVLREANVLVPDAEMHGVRPYLLRALMRRFYPWASAIIAVSKSVAASLIDGLGLSPAQVRTIYNPIVTPDIASRAAEPLDDPWFALGAPPVVLAVGRLAPEKDFATLLRAFARLRAARAARLVILGEGKERGALEALAHELGIGGEVRLPGFEPNPFRYMARAPVFALSSIYEGLPGALIQAMACGCRAISTDCPGGSREVLEDGALGPLVRPRDPAAMARGLAALLDEAARTPARPRHPLGRFTEAAAVDQYLDVLGAAPATRRGPPGTAA